MAHPEPISLGPSPVEGRPAELPPAHGPGVPGAVSMLVTLVDLALLPAICLFSPLALVFRRINPKRLPASSRLFELFGIWPIRRHYYEPLFHEGDLTQPLGAIRDLPIDLNEAGQLALARAANHADEIRALDWSSPVGSGDNSGFDIGNPFFKGGDAETLYNLVRHFKPRTMIEVGSGHSTKVAQQALARNAQEGHATRHVCIEPFEQPWLETLGPEIMRRKVEETDHYLVSSLEANDILFIDSSHVIRPQGDVLFEYLEVIPRLKPGVIVHVHDIFTPRDYPHDWVVREKRFWNEQYLLECLLTNTTRYEVLFAANFMKTTHFDVLRESCPYLEPAHEPGSFYFRIRG